MVKLVFPTINFKSKLFKDQQLDKKVNMHFILFFDLSMNITKLFAIPKFISKAKYVGLDLKIYLFSGESKKNSMHALTL